MDDTTAMLDLLVQRYAFAEVAALVDSHAARHDDLHVANIQQLCAFGMRLLDLDAEDFGAADAARDANTANAVAERMRDGAVPAGLVLRSLRSRMPQSATESDRGALRTLAPAFGLLLEVVAVRWLRRETPALVAALHIASEYLPLLAWASTLGHAADPIRMPTSVGGDGSRWGDQDDRSCPHTWPQKSAAARSLRVADQPDSGWRAYLDKQHSIVSEAFGMCAADCPKPCTVITRHAPAQRASLATRCHLASEFTGSAVIRLRHSAPVGHGFGVPSPAEVTDAWSRTRATLGARAPALLADDTYPLPGLPALFSVLADQEIRPDTIIADTVAALRGALRQGGAV